MALDLATLMALYGIPRALRFQGQFFCSLEIITLCLHLWKKTTVFVTITIHSIQAQFHISFFTVENIYDQLLLSRACVVSGLCRCPCGSALEHFL